MLSCVVACAAGAEPGTQSGIVPFPGGSPAADAPAGTDDDDGDDGDDDESDDDGSEFPDPPPVPEPDDGGDSLADCCASTDMPGCNDPDIAQCVCEQQPECCTQFWADGCVLRGVQLGCMECVGAGDDGGAAGDDGGPPGGDSGGGGAPTNDCCTTSLGPGCTDGAVEACVCAADSFCCDNEWDDVCVDLVDSESCGNCGGAPAGGGGGTPTNACCTPSTTPGCGNLIIEACVCIDDPICCLFGWDQICVDEVTSLSCGTC